jgi:hypothetical protein
MLKTHLYLETKISDLASFMAYISDNLRFS